MKPHPGIEALRKEQPWLLSGGNIDDEIMEMIARLVWHAAFEWHENEQGAPKDP